MFTKILFMTVTWSFFNYILIALSGNMSNIFSAKLEKCHFKHCWKFFLRSVLSCNCHRRNSELCQTAPENAIQVYMPLCCDLTEFLLLDEPRSQHCAPVTCSCAVQTYTVVAINLWLLNYFRLRFI